MNAFGVVVFIVLFTSIMNFLMNIYIYITLKTMKQSGEYKELFEDEGGEVGSMTVGFGEEV